MVSSVIKLAAIMTALAIVIGVASCNNGVKGTETTTVIEGDRSAEVIDTYQAQATVSAIDATRRTITLLSDEGGKTTVKAGKNVFNFNQLKVGDRVMATITEDYLAELRPGNAPPSATASNTVALATAGQSSAAFQAATFETTARVMSVDAKHRKISLRFVDGSSKTFKAGKNINMANVHAGDDVIVSVAESVAIAVIAGS